MDRLPLSGHARPALRSFVLAFAAALAAAASGPLAASTFVMVQDGALADQAALIAEATVESAGPYLPPAGAEPAIATEYRMRVTRLIKGARHPSEPGEPSELIVRVPGGGRAHGLSAHLAGAPQFAPHETLLLFLEPRPDGSWRVLHLFLGAFHVLTTRTGERVAVRSLGGASELRLGRHAAAERGHEPARSRAPGNAAGDLDRPRAYDRFLAWLAARTAGAPSQTAATAPHGGGDCDCLVDLAPGDVTSLQEKFTLFFVGGVANERWFEFDRGASVPFYAYQGGQPNLDGGGFAEFQSALLAWNDNPGTLINLAYGGTTAAQGALASYNGTNEISFDDPFGELTPFDCAHGGFLAYTQTFYELSLLPWHGAQYAQMRGAHIITNKNIGCAFAAGVTPSNLAETLFTHEVGHGVGLAHACGDAVSPPCTDPVLNDASMRAAIHFDGRGTRLASDDQAGARVLYGSSVAPAPRCKPNGQTLCLDHGRFAVTAGWTNQYNQASGAGGAILGTDEAGYFYFTDPANVELMVKVLQLGSVFKVFYGQLTDLELTLSVTDTLHDTAHTYHNTPGNCGGIDENAFAAGASIGEKRGGGCRAGGQTLCLLSGRFAVDVTWANPGNGTSGNGSGRPFSDEVGTFTFTDPANVELMTKLVEFPDRIAFFWGALSDLPYVITVTDTGSGKQQIYRSAAGKLCGGLDNHAF